VSAQRGCFIRYADTDSWPINPQHVLAGVCVVAAALLLGINASKHGQIQYYSDFEYKIAN
jgi:hypothetical protein